ncbi:MAG: aminodeoxychorismate/anthranilate synthase component II [Saprospiraceae bacterium]
MRKPQILIVDNYDSFTYNLFDYFCQLNMDCKVVRNNELTLEQFCELDFDGLVLSPGPKRPADAGLLMPLLDYYHDKKPILGICLGHQGIGEYFGAKLSKTKVPVHGKTSVINHTGHPLFGDLPKRYSVMRYHSLALEKNLPASLEIIAETDDGEIMAIAHRNLPITGVQFHPESILTEHGIVLLENWVQMITIGLSISES